MTKLRYSTIDFEKVLQKGTDALDNAGTEVLGNLRAGNTGCIINGNVLGCHRTLVARALGFQFPPSDNSKFYFQGGRGAEATTEDFIKAGWDGTYKCEEDAAFSWKTEKGRLVTGRTDFLLRKPGSTPEAPEDGLVVEHKAIMGTKTMHERWFEAKPDAKHLCQAAHNAWQHNLPGVLTYTCCVTTPVDFRIAKKLGLPWGAKIDPFRMHFYFAIKDGVVVYKHPDSSDEIETAITIEGIKDFYELTDYCLRSKDLAMTPVDVDVLGKAKWDHMRFCESCQTAENVGYDFDAWVDELTILCRKKG